MSHRCVTRLTHRGTTMQLHDLREALDSIVVEDLMRAYRTVNG